MEPSPYNSGFENSKIISEMTQVLGPTCQQESQLLVTSKDLVIYTSGSMIVFYNTQLNQQVKYISHRTRNIAALAITPDGTQLAVGESGKVGAIVIYDLNPIDSVLTKPKLIVPMKKQSVSLLAYSLDGRYLVSLSNEDNKLSVWEGDKSVCANKISNEPKRINKVIFIEDGNLMTVGRQHFKLWTFADGKILRSITVGIRRDMVDKDFVNVVSRNGHLLALTSDGFLIKVSKDGKLLLYSEITLSTDALEIVGGEVLVGGKNADIRLFNIETLKTTRLFNNKPPPIGYENIEKNGSLSVNVEGKKYPRCLAIKSLNSNKLVTLYDNRMIFVWTVTPSGIYGDKAFLGHRDEIICATLLDEISESVTFFATSSIDQTIKIWHIYNDCFNSLTASIDLASVIDIKRNAYCRNLTRIIYSDVLVSHIKCYKSRLLAFSRCRLDFYLLTDFSLESTFSLSDESTCVELANDRIYQGCQDQVLRIHSLAEGQLVEASTLYKLSHPIESMAVNAKEIYCLGKGTLSVISQVSNHIISVYNNVDCIWSHLTNVYWSSSSKLTIYNTEKGRPRPPVEMRSLLNLRPAHLIRATSSYIITVKTDSLPNIVTVWNLEGKYLCEEPFGENINDIMCTEGGDTVIVGKSGTVIIWKFIFEEKLINFREMFQDKLLQESLINSIWMSGSSSNIPPSIINPKFNVKTPTPEPSPKPAITQQNNELEESSPIILEVPSSKIRFANRISEPQAQAPAFIPLGPPIASPQSELKKQAPPPLMHPPQNSGSPGFVGPSKVNNFMSPQRTPRAQEFFNVSDIANQTRQIIDKVSNQQKELRIQDVVIADSMNLGSMSIEFQPPPPSGPINRESIVLERNVVGDSFKFGAPKTPTYPTPSKSDALGDNCNSITINDGKVVMDSSEVKPFLPKDGVQDTPIEMLTITRFANLINSVESSSGGLQRLFEENRTQFEQIYLKLDKHFGNVKKQRQRRQLEEATQAYLARVGDILRNDSN